MIRIQLDDTSRSELHRLRHTKLSDTARDRLETILLSDAGCSPPRITHHLGCHPHAGRAVPKSHRQRGLACLQPQRPGPPPDQQRRQRPTERLTDLRSQQPTWTSRQLAEALQPEILLSPRQVLRYLVLLKARYHQRGFRAPTVNFSPQRSKLFPGSLPGRDSVARRPEYSLRLACPGTS